MSQPISDPVRNVLDLFSSQLAEVRFPDVDAKALDQAAQEVLAAAEALAGAEAEVELARKALSDHQETLLRKAQRALAYARVYAESDDALAARLDAITLPRAVRKSRPDGGDALFLSADAEAPRRRGRTRKADAEGDTLALGPIGVESAAQ